MNDDELARSVEALKGLPWAKYESSERTYIKSLGDAPLVPNHPDADSYDLEVQHLVPVYLNFEIGRFFFFWDEAVELGVDLEHWQACLRGDEQNWSEE